MPKKVSKGKRRYIKGKSLEDRVEAWVKRTLGYKSTERNIPVRGKISKRPYEIDVHAWKPIYLGLSEEHIIVECKALKVKRIHVMKLNRVFDDICEAYEEGIEKWKPTQAILVSNVGFDIDAKELAKKYGIECYLATKRGFKKEVELEEEEEWY